MHKCTDDLRLWLYLSNENDEERMLTHKGDSPTTYFIEIHLGETDQRYYHVHFTLRHCSLRGSVHSIHK